VEVGACARVRTPRRASRSISTLQLHVTNARITGVTRTDSSRPPGMKYVVRPPVRHRLFLLEDHPAEEQSKASAPEGGQARFTLQRSPEDHRTHRPESEHREVISSRVVPRR